MREDARRLLGILGEHDFHYREFVGRFSDLELWPLLQHLLDDARVQRAYPHLSGWCDVAGHVPAVARPQDARAMLGQLAEMAAAGTL